MAVAAYCIALGLRLLEAPGWSNPMFSLDGEYLLATHDAYHWAAGAVGFEFGTGHPMAVLIALLARLTGAGVANVAFWLPPFLSSLVAPVVVVWAAVFGVRSGGVVAGVLASLAPGFMARTLLGFGDTDLVTLLFSLLLGLTPAIWLAPWLRSPAAVLLKRLGIDSRKFRLTDQPEDRGFPLSRVWLIALFLAGCFGWWGQHWHSFFPYLTRGYAGIIPILILLFAQRKVRLPLLAGSLAYALPMVGGWPGMLASAGLGVAVAFGPQRLRAWLVSPWPLAALWAAVVVFMIDPAVLQTFFRAVSSYVKTAPAPLEAAQAGRGLTYPQAAQSIVETQDLKLSEILNYLHPWLVVSALGVLGFVVLLFVTPTATLHLPLIALAFLGCKLGGRMVMFGSASIALGFAVPVCRWVQRALIRFLPGFFSGRGRAASFILPELLLGVFLIPYVYLIPLLTQGPVLDVEHARAFKAIRSFAPENSVIWDWWDFGYAAHYLARRHTLADGARHADAHLFLPALVYTTDNPRLAAQLMRRAGNAASPNDVLAGMSPEQAKAFFKKLGEEDMPLPPGRPQYLVVSFDLLRLAYWISKYGTWDFSARQGAGYPVSIVSQPLKFLLKNGTVMAQGMPPVLADSIDVFGNATVERQSYLRFNGRHFLFNTVTGDKLSMGDELYNSLMVQLLIAAPDDPRFTPYFKLVHDSPACRVYEVRQATEPTSARQPPV